MLEIFWVPDLAAGGPYWVLISLKVGSLFRSLFLSLKVPVSFGNSAMAPRNGLKDKASAKVKQGYWQGQ